MQEQSGRYTAEEYEYELQNRMKNLLWTVSGDYELDVELDIRSFQRSKYISLYDAVKQGRSPVIFPTGCFLDDVRAAAIA